YTVEGSRLLRNAMNQGIFESGTAIAKRGTFGSLAKLGAGEKRRGAGRNPPPHDQPLAAIAQPRAARSFSLFLFDLALHQVHVERRLPFLLLNLLLEELLGVVLLVEGEGADFLAGVIEDDPESPLANFLRRADALGRGLLGLGGGLFLGRLLLFLF